MQAYYSHKKHSKDRVMYLKLDWETPCIRVMKESWESPSPWQPGSLANRYPSLRFLRPWIQTRVQPDGNFIWERWRSVHISPSLKHSYLAQRVTLLFLRAITQRVGTRTTSSLGRWLGPVCRWSIPRSLSKAGANHSMISFSKSDCGLCTPPIRS